MNRLYSLCVLLFLATANVGCNALLSNDLHDLSAGDGGEPGTGSDQDGAASVDGNVSLSSDGATPRPDATSQHDATSQRDANAMIDGAGGPADATLTDGNSAADGTPPVVPDGPASGSDNDATSVVDAKVAADAQPLLSQGSSCTTTPQCGGGLSCADGVCCDKPCTGSCEQCNLPSLKGTCSSVPEGQAAAPSHTACATSVASTCQTNGKCDGSGKCEFWSNGTSCGAGSCNVTTNMATSGFACDGAGACKAKSSITCAPFKCAAGGVTCAIGCSTGSDCVGQPCVNSSCGTVANGSACTSSSQCTSSNCIDGYCCDLACSGSCQACDVAGREGACSTVPSGSPHGSRSCSGAGTCKGSCTGSASCTYPTGTCSSQSCANGVETLAASCDGAGACGTPATTSCLGFACNGTACYRSCSGDSECGSATPYCFAGACQSLAPLGHGCSVNGECAMGFCVDKVCCGTSSCPGTDSCHNASTCGSGGACSARTVKSGASCDDANMCTQNDTCQSDGSCSGTAVICTADSCHVAGTCVKASGCPTPTPKVVHSSSPVNFAFTGGPASWQIPACVTQITVTAAGAQGGLGDFERLTGANPGGLGSQVFATLTVTPQSTLQINVGGAGSGDADTPKNPGYNGGGACPLTGGCGGGATDIRVSPFLAAPGADDRILVAGGGGGGALAEPGGAGGGLVGGIGCNTNCGTGQGEGAGGTQSAGGAAGVQPSTLNLASAVGNGGLFLGGAGGQCYNITNLTPDNWGGGGGGGYYGGGGGCESGGGGGSSFVKNASNVTLQQGPQTGNGYVTITW